MREQRGLLMGNFRKALFQHRCDVGVQLARLAAEEGLAGCIVKEGVFEDIDSVWRHAAAVEKLRLHEPLQRLSQALLGKRIGNGAYCLIRKLSTEHGTGLR